MTGKGMDRSHVIALLGVYVLGGLRGAQEARVRAHLEYCAQCRTEYEELAEVTRFLDMITGEEAAQRPAAPADSLRNGTAPDLAAEGPLRRPASRKA
jgi:predicted anti-sigma-YlaC factor YlaD